MKGGSCGLLSSGIGKVLRTSFSLFTLTYMLCRQGARGTRGRQSARQRRRAAVAAVAPTGGGGEVGGQAAQAAGVHHCCYLRAARPTGRGNQREARESRLPGRVLLWCRPSAPPAQLWLCEMQEGCFDTLITARLLENLPSWRQLFMHLFSPAAPVCSVHTPQQHLEAPIGHRSGQQLAAGARSLLKLELGASGRL